MIRMDFGVSDDKLLACCSIMALTALSSSYMRFTSRKFSKPIHRESQTSSVGWTTFDIAQPINLSSLNLQNHITTSCLIRGIGMNQAAHLLTCSINVQTTSKIKQSDCRFRLKQSAAPRHYSHLWRFLHPRSIALGYILLWWIGMYFGMPSEIRLCGTAWARRALSILFRIKRELLSSGVACRIPLFTFNASLHVG